MQVITFGCRLNAYESELMREKAQDLDDNVFIINTCAVTAEAERQCRQEIRKIKKEHPNAHIIVTGCSAQLNPQIYEKMPEVDQIIGNRSKINPQSFHSLQRVILDDLKTSDNTTIPFVQKFEGLTRAFLQIQQGCDHRCTFCIVNQVRGKNVGLDPDLVIQRAQNFICQGYAELVLTGVDITSYPFGFSNLVERILKEVKGLKRLRLGSLDPAGIDDHLLCLWKDYEQLMPHMHLSVQAGDDTILRRMARRHRKADVIKIADQIRKIRPDFVLGADFITGFPTETDLMFEQTLDLVEKAQIALLHVFPFSIRPSTPSADMPMVEPAIRKRRAYILRQKGQLLLTQYLNNHLDQPSVVLIEKDNKGLNEHYIPVFIQGKTLPNGTIIKTMNKGIFQNGFMAQI